MNMQWIGQLGGHQTASFCSIDSMTSSLDRAAKGDGDGSANASWISRSLRTGEHLRPQVIVLATGIVPDADFRIV